MGLLACRAGVAVVVALCGLSQRLDVRVLRLRPAQAGSEEFFRVSRADLLAQKHSWEVLLLHEVNFDVSMLPMAAVWGLLGLFTRFIGVGVLTAHLM